MGSSKGKTKEEIMALTQPPLIVVKKQPFARNLSAHFAAAKKHLQSIQPRKPE